MATKAHIERFAKLATIGCICCRLNGTFNDQIEIHHIIHKGTRQHSGGHRATLPLCAAHHRSVIPDGVSRAEFRRLYGPSIADGSRVFAERFGTQLELLDRVDKLIGAPPIGDPWRN